MYCSKCGNLLKKEDNFCSICGTPNHADAKRAKQGISGYNPIRDDEPIHLDDFFMTDEKTERTLEKMDKELDEIKVRATENLMRRKNGDAGARRAARLAKKADTASRDKHSYEFDSDFNFNDETFQKSIERDVRESRTAQRGRAKEKNGARTSQRQEEDFFQSDIPESQLQSPVEQAPPQRSAAKAKRHHLFREDTVELPNIFDEIAQSMEKTKKQKRGSANVGRGKQPMEQIASEDWSEGIFPVSAANDLEEGVFPLPPKEDLSEGFKEDFTEGIFALPPKKERGREAQAVFKGDWGRKSRTALKEDLGGEARTAFKEDLGRESRTAFKEDVMTETLAFPYQDELTEGIFPLPPKDPAAGAHETKNIPGAGSLATEYDDLDGEDLIDDITGTSAPRSWGMEADEAEGQAAPYALRRSSRLQSSQPKGAENEQDYEYFRYRSKKRRGPNPALIAVAVLVVIAAALGAKMLYEGQTPASVFHELQEAFSASAQEGEAEGTKSPDTLSTPAAIDEGATARAGSGADEPSIDQLKEEGISDPAKMLRYVLSKGINKNIWEIQYNAELKYDEAARQNTADIVNSTPVKDEVFTEKNGVKYYASEVIMSTMVQYNSQWIDYFNKEDKSVLKLIAKGSKAYQNAVNFSPDGAQEDFMLFEIGEMRKGEKGYYVWTRETYSITKESASRTDDSAWIYYLEPSGESLKIVNYFNN